MDTYEMREDTKEMLEILRKQRENMTPRKARKLFKQLGIYHLLTPKVSPQKTPKDPAKGKKAHRSTGK